ncbi:PREDICTED: probable glycosyltransferase At5g03795 [Ipomoea nil]|uniref:probable glycosyltransferase At5g03795 n=1 Tax=Ipomoea nil TaxID=35883 RepID=UPI000900CCCF|nr:PREDICTED: probable glycosyltransferase At5g03795 [Ipomoea nil]
MKMMEGLKKRVWKSSSSSSSSTRLLWITAPLLILVGLVLALGSSKASSTWVFADSYYPWSWGPFLARDNQIPGSPPPPPPPNDSSTQPPSTFPSVVPPDNGGGGKILAYNSSINSSTSPLHFESQEIQQPDIQKEENLNISSSIPSIISSSNETGTPLQVTIKRKFRNLERLEANLGKARAAIRAAVHGINQTDDHDYVPTGPVYWNANVFHRSYLEMEKQFKIFVYEEGEPPVFHNGPCKSIYASEGNFIYHMETSPFRTRDPEKAHVFFLPISITAIVHFVYDRSVHNKEHWLPMKQTVSDYINLVAGKYAYWNRSLGADHFMLACHDWGPEISKAVPELFKNSIRALCNANTSEGFKPSKDVSIPEILLPGGTMHGLIGGPSPSRRSILAFFAGGLHGPIRPILLEHWENKDNDVQVHRYLPKGISYYEMLRKTKFCICPSGYEVASPRMVEALYTGCVPVLIKDHYVAPFSDVLNWKSFSVEVPVEDIPNLKKILTGISQRRYIRLQRRGLIARRHFEVNLPPKRYDVTHMILHSAWLRRLNVRLHGIEDT